MPDDNYLIGADSGTGRDRSIVMVATTDDVTGKHVIIESTPYTKPSAYYAMWRRSQRRHRKPARRLAMRRRKRAQRAKRGW